MAKAMEEAPTKVDAALVMVQAVVLAVADANAVPVTMTGAVARATTMGTKARTMEAPRKDLTIKTKPR